jgi:hypothetical protein
VRRLLALLITATGLAHAQRPPGFVRGVVTENTPLSFSVRTVDGDIYRYRADGKTWIERDHERTRAATLAPGEILEVVSDRDPDPVRYARMVHVIQPAVARPLPVSTGGIYRLKPAAPLDTAIYTGFIAARDRDRFTLRTRLDGDKSIYLQTDTQCLQDGDLVDSGALLVLRRVYVVAVRGTDRELVAQQVIWGSILQPDQP